MKAVFCNIVFAVGIFTASADYRFGTINSGSLADGFASELLEKLMEQTGQNYSLEVMDHDRYGVLVDGNWVGLIGDVHRGDLDAALTDMTVTRARMAAVDFSLPFLSTGLVLVANKDSPAASVAALLASPDAKIAFIGGGATARTIQAETAEGFLGQIRDLPEAQKVTVESVAEGVQSARDDANVAFLMEGVAARKSVGAQPCDLQILGDRLNTIHYSVAVKKQFPPVLKRGLDEAIATLGAQGALKALEAKHFPDNCM